MSELEKEKVTENVADLLINKIKTLPMTTQKILHYASLIGNKFNTSIIASALKEDMIAIDLALWHASAKKLIVSTNEQLKDQEYTFLHDKIQSACLNDQLFNILESHKIIGKSLLKKYGKETSTNHLTKITYHLNKALDNWIIMK